MKSLKVTIIIPTYNAGLTLKKCLESILSQKFESYEVVIIDGLSTDNTIDIIKHFTNLNNNIRFISEKDKGIYDAMNKGIKMARGNWLYFLGSDDYLFNDNSLKKVAEHLADDFDIVYGDTIWIPENFIDKGVKDLKHLLYGGINHQRIFYRRDVFEKNGCYKEIYKLASDLEFNIRLFCNKKINKKYINIFISYYYTGGRSYNKIDEEFWGDWRSIIYKNFSPHLPKKIIYERLNWYCWHLMNQKKFKASSVLFCRIFFSTFSISFLKHCLSQSIKISRLARRNNLGTNHYQVEEFKNY